MKALLLLASLFLFNNMEITSQLPPHNQRTEQVVVYTGKFSVEVFPEDHKSDISCVYWHLNEKLSTQEHTTRCFLTINSSLPAYIWIDVVNNENHMITYKVRSGSVMKLKSR